jgi:ABC-2 type transport system permease protein
MTAFVQETGAQLNRWLIRMRREPFSLGFALAQPILIFIFFGSAFEQVVPQAIAGDSYLSFLLGGVLALTVFGNSIGGGIMLLFDKEGGFLTRCLVAPISRSSIFIARFLAVNIISAIQIVMVVGLAHLFGVRVETGLLGLVAMIGIGWLLGLGATVISLSLVFTLRGHADFFTLVGTITLPVAFLSNAFAPLDRMPGWMQAVARLNPMTYAVEAMRSLITEPTLQLAVVGRAAAALVLFDVVMLTLGVRVLRRHVR